MNVVKSKQAFIEDANHIINGMRWDMRTGPTPVEKRRFDAAVRQIETAERMERAALEHKVARRRVRQPRIGRYRVELLG